MTSTVRTVSSVILLTLFCTLSGFSQLPVWKKVFDGQGISIGINPYNGNTAYCQGNDLGLYVTRNAGASWSLVNPSIPYETREIIVHPNDTTTIFVVNFSDGLYRSTDAGATFTLVLGGYGIDGESVVYDPVHPDTMYAGNFGDAGVFRSVNRGATWTLMGHAGTTGNLCALIVRPDSANILYAGTGAGTISKSNDSGKTWKQVKSGGSQEIPKMVINPHNPSIALAAAYAGNPNSTGIWKTTDGGETWNLTSLHNISMWSMDIDYAHPDTVYSGTFSEYGTAVYRTTDAGTTWSQLNQGFVPYNSLWNLKVDRQNGTKLYIAATHGDFNPDGVFVLTDATAEIAGFVLDSLTVQTITSGIVQVSPSGEQYDLAVTNGAYHAYRYPGDLSTSRTFSVYINSVLFYQQTISFVNGAINPANLLVQPGSVSGTVYNDQNGNGTKDGGEPGLGGWVVQLTGPVVLNTLTDNSGNYSFTNLFPGTYTIREQTSFGYRLTEPADSTYSVTVSLPAKDFPGRNFGNLQKHRVSSVSPLPFKNNVAAGVVIQATFDTAMNSASFHDTSTLFVRGSVSGYHHAGLLFDGSHTVLSITPTTPFYPGEVVTVDISKNVTTAVGGPMTPWSWQFTVATSPSNGDFAPKADYNVGLQPWAVAAGDIDNDGDVDIVTANAVASTVSVLKNNGDGTFAPKIDYPTGSAPRGISLADVNNDGYLDVVVANNSATTVTVLLNDHNGGFSSRNDYPVGGTASTIAVANLSGTGNLDIISMISTHNTVSVITNNGSTFSAPVAYSAGQFPWAAQAADLNGDGGNDLAVVNSNGTPSVFGVLQNTGDGTLATPVPYSLGSYARGVAVTDLDNDGRPDVLATNSVSDSWTFYLQASNGSFGSRTDINTGHLPWFMATGDLNGDGQIDVCIANASANSVSVYQNLTGTTFSRLDYPTGQGPHGVALADLNGDGTLDIIVANSNDNTVSVIFNAVSVPEAAGWNMISVPIAAQQLLKSSVFPTASSNAFAYNNGYIAEDTLVQGAGYWVKFDSATTATFVGKISRYDSIPLSGGWNLIGTIGVSVPVASLFTVPSGLIESAYFSYNGSYQIATTLDPGEAYWVRSSGPGALVISSSHQTLAVGRSTVQSSTEGLSSLTVTDATGRQAKLYFTSAADQTFGNAVLPPPPPEGSFDVRFAGNRFVAAGRGAIPLVVSGAIFPVKVSWLLTDTELRQWALSAGTTTVPFERDGSVTLRSPSELKALTLRSTGIPGEIPHAYALRQNYPNPFNPTTEIRYELPFRSHVVLTVMNLLGETVQELVNDNQESGAYSTTIALKGASGVYYYRLQAVALDKSNGQFEEVRKMILMK